MASKHRTDEDLAESLEKSAKERTDLASSESKKSFIDILKGVLLAPIVAIVRLWQRITMGKEGAQQSEQMAIKYARSIEEAKQEERLAENLTSRMRELLKNNRDAGVEADITDIEIKKADVGGEKDIRFAMDFYVHKDGLDNDIRYTVYIDQDMNIRKDGLCSEEIEDRLQKMLDLAGYQGRGFSGKEEERAEEEVRPEQTGPIVETTNIGEIGYNLSDGLKVSKVCDVDGNFMARISVNGTVVTARTNPARTAIIFSDNVRTMQPSDIDAVRIAMYKQVKHPTAVNSTEELIQYFTKDFLQGAVANNYDANTIMIGANLFRYENIPTGLRCYTYSLLSDEVTYIDYDHDGNRISDPKPTPYAYDHLGVFRDSNNSEPEHGQDEVNDYLTGDDILNDRGELFTDETPVPDDADAPEDDGRIYTNPEDFPDQPEEEWLETEQPPIAESSKKAAETKAEEQEKQEAEHQKLSCSTCKDGDTITVTLSHGPDTYVGTRYASGLIEVYPPLPDSIENYSRSELATQMVIAADKAASENGVADPCQYVRGATVKADFVNDLITVSTHNDRNVTAIYGHTLFDFTNGTENKIIPNLTVSGTDEHRQPVSFEHPEAQPMTVSQLMSDYCAVNKQNVPYSIYDEENRTVRIMGTETRSTDQFQVLVKSEQMYGENVAIIDPMFNTDDKPFVHSNKRKDAISLGNSDAIAEIAVCADSCSRDKAAEIAAKFFCDTKVSPTAIFMADGFCFSKESGKLSITDTRSHTEQHAFPTATITFANSGKYTPEAAEARLRLKIQGVMNEFGSEAERWGDSLEAREAFVKENSAEMDKDDFDISDEGEGR